MKNYLTIFSFVFVFMFSVTSLGQRDPAYQKSLQETQQLLESPTQRDQAIKGSPDAQKAYNQLKGVAKDKKTEDEYFELTSQIMGNYSSADNDQALIQDVQKGMIDPETFYNKLTDAQKRKINELSQKIAVPAGSNP